MPNKKNFVYIDDASIDAEFKCSICLDPFDNPVDTPCGHTFCRECIERAIKSNAERVCPTCRRGPLSNSNLKPANRIISNRIDRYTVKCLLCQQRNIQRGHFEEHLSKLCAKADVSCPAADVRCLWVGTRDQLQGHTFLCLYTQIRPVLSELLSANETLREQLNMQVAQLISFQDEITKQSGLLTKMKVEHTAQLEKLKNEQTKALQSMRDEINQQTKKLNEIATASLQKKKHDVGECCSELVS